MLTPAQKESIVNQLSERIQKPIVNKKPLVKTVLGKLALKMVVNEVDAVLSRSLPPEISTLLSSAADGLTPEETQHLKEVLPPYLLQNVHNVILQGALAEIMVVIVDILIDALQQGKSLQ